MKANKWKTTTIILIIALILGAIGAIIYCNNLKQGGELGCSTYVEVNEDNTKQPRSFVLAIKDENYDKNLPNEFLYYHGIYQDKVDIYGSCKKISDNAAVLYNKDGTVFGYFVGSADKYTLLYEGKAIPFKFVDKGIVVDSGATEWPYVHTDTE